MVDPKIRQEIPHSQVGPAKILADEEKNCPGDSKTKITQEDQFRILGLVQWTGRVKVVDAPEPAIALPLTTAFMLALMLVMSSDVRTKV